MHLCSLGIFKLDGTLCLDHGMDVVMTMVKNELTSLCIESSVTWAKNGGGKTTATGLVAVISMVQ